MIEEITEDIYRIEIPLPNNPLKFVNSYVIKAPDRNLIVDTGMNREECMDAMKGGLRELGVDLRNADLFITHFHVDHLGLASKLLTGETAIYSSQPEAERIENMVFGDLWDRMINFFRMNGFPEKELKEILNHHPAHVYGLKEKLDFKFLEDDDTLHIGNYQFKCIKTPGHSKGHLCLYEPGRKILISGDHILDGITPNISLRSNTGNPLREYLMSLDRVYHLDIELVLPGHRNIFKKCKERINELKWHHQKRSEETASFLEKAGMNAYQLASLMSWEVDCDSWDSFPVMQKWFAVGEVTAHLKYLEERGVIRKEVRDEKVTYSLNS
jgi:glyoxylase-like metal-dependent hydrolase (beta-lactamase superfamily II)